MNGFRVRTHLLSLLCAACLISLASSAIAAPGDNASTPFELFSGPTLPAQASPHAFDALEGRFDAAGLARGVPFLQLRLPTAGDAVAERTGFEQRGRGDFTWRGRVVDAEDSEVTLTLKRGMIFGRVLLDDETYEFSSRPGKRLTVERLDIASLPSCGTEHEHYREGDVQGSGTPLAAMAADTGLTIDLLVVYSNDALADRGSVEAMEAMVQAAVDAANTSFINSAMTPRYRLVHSAHVNYDTGGSTSTDLSWVRADAQVAALREQYGADMVHILVDTPTSCGTAYVQRSPGAGFATWAFAATDVDCAVGNLTFAHEHGHNMGMEHNAENSSADATSASYPHSFAHYVNGSFRTVMSYSSPCTSGCGRTSKFSNPDITHNGFATGIAGSRDNAQTGDLTGPVVAAFRDTVVSEGVANPVMSWVPPYAISQAQAAAQADFGTCDAADGLSRIGLQFWTPNPDGSIKYANHEWYTPQDSDVAWWTNWGSANGIEVYLTIYNNDGSWNWPLARAGFATNRATFVAALVAEMDRLGLDGIDLDLEGIDGDIIASDRAEFDQFVHELWLETSARGKGLTVNSFPYIWNAPNQDWWSDWAGEVDNIQAMGYENLYEGATGWQQYSYQQAIGQAAGHSANTVLMGMPGWLASWGTSSGRGTTALAHVEEVHYDLPLPTGIAIWDMQLAAWQDAGLWCAIGELRDGTGGGGNVAPAAGFDVSTSELSASFTDTSTDSDGSIVSWSWTFGDGNGSTAQSPGHTYGAAGTYTVSLTVTDDAGASDSTSQAVTVTEPNTAPVADAGPDQSLPDSDGVAGESVTLDGSGSSDSDGSIASYAWLWSGGNASGVGPTVRLPDGTTLVTLTVTDDDGAAGQDTVSVTVAAPPPPEFWDQYALTSATAEGTSAGAYTLTHADDGNAQVITEAESNGKPEKRRSSLQHNWTFDVKPGTAISLMANAWISGPVDIDAYIFAWSIDGSPFNDLFTVSSTNPGNVETAVLPSNLDGTVTLRVTDTDNGQGERVLGELSVDYLVIHTDNVPVTPPAAPSGLSAVAVAHDQVDLAWTDNAGDETAYEVERADGGQGNWSTVATLAADGSAWSDTGVVGNATYDYRVRALKGATPSAYTTFSGVTTPAGPPPSPITLTVTGSKVKGRLSADLEWTGASGADVDITRDGAPVATTANDGQYTDAIGKGGGSYSYVVCEAGTTTCSDPVTLTF